MILAVPHAPPRTGGVGSFQIRLAHELARRGHRMALAGDAPTADAVLVFGGTRRLAWLASMRARGVPVVHRLGPLNWRYRTGSRSWREALAERARNRLLRFVRDRMADRVVYQSAFARDWWHRWYGPAPVPETVVHNGVDLREFAPRPVPRGDGKTRIVCVEGSVPSNPVSIAIVRAVASTLVVTGRVEEIRVYGRCRSRAERALRAVPGVRLAGSVPREEIPARLAAGDLFLGLEMNAACPNSAIEALASGLPVVTLDTGAYRELVGPEAGIFAPFLGDPWSARPPDLEPLVDAIAEALERLPDLSRAARRRAEERLGIERAAAAYLDVVERAVD